MDGRSILRGSSVAILAVASPLALVPGKVEVKANRPGVEVRTRSGYYAPKRNEKRPTDLLVNGLPGGDLPLHVTTAVVARPGGADVEVVVVTRIDRTGAFL